MYILLTKQNTVAEIIPDYHPAFPNIPIEKRYTKEFISKLLYDEPRSFEVSTIGPDFIIHILKESVKKVDFPLTGELLAEIIYDKKSPKSLAGIWDKSLHVVTNDKRYPTPVGTLNFIFADDEI